MSLFEDDLPDPKLKKMEKELKWLRFRWWIEDHSFHLFVVTMTLILLLTCGGC